MHMYYLNPPPSNYSPTVPHPQAEVVGIWWNYFRRECLHITSTTPLCPAPPFASLSGRKNLKRGALLTKGLWSVNV